MKRLFLLFLPFLFFVAGTFVACEEVEEGDRVTKLLLTQSRGKPVIDLYLPQRMLMKWKRVNYLQYRCRQPVPI